MAFNLDDYLPKQNKWFSIKIVYKGEGIAEFSNPKGWVKGQTEINFDETGKASVEMKVEDYFVSERIETENPDYDNFHWLLTGRKPQINGSFVFRFGGRPDNKCEGLVVRGRQGVFRTIGYLGHHISENSTNERRIFFDVSRSIFESKSSEPPKYWVMPLSNFVSENLNVIQSHIVGTTIYNHPLLLWRYPSIPINLDEENMASLRSRLNNWTSVTAFEYNNTRAFFEPLSDYRKREKRLTTGKVKNLITSIMVGQIGNQTVGYNALTDWVPLELLHLLSLSTGSLVGTPWIEFRGEKGDLIQRIHNSQSNDTFHRGHNVLKWNCQKGIFHLLSVAPKKFDPHLRTAILLTIKGAQEVFDAADSLNFFFRAFDTLTKDIRQNKRKTGIHDDRLNSVREVLQGAGKQISTIADQTVSDEKAAIKSIANIVANADQPKRHNEAEGIIELSKSLGLHDFSVIEEKDWWIKLYTKYRTQIIHEGFFSTKTDTYNIDEIGYLYFYLHDLLLRMVLTMLNYDGEYMSRISNSKYVVNEFVNWVTPELTPKSIGIGRKFFL